MRRLILSMEHHTAFDARALPPPRNITPENNKLNHILIKFWKRIWMGSSFRHLRSADMFLTLEKLNLELIYLLKELSEFGINDILMKVKCNVIQGK